MAKRELVAPEKRKKAMFVTIKESNVRYLEARAKSLGLNKSEYIDLLVQRERVKG